MSCNGNEVVNDHARPISSTGPEPICDLQTHFRFALKR